MTDIQDIVRSHGPEAAFELLLLRQRVAGSKSFPESEAFLSAVNVSPALFAGRLSAHALGGMLLPFLPASLSTHPDMVQLAQGVEGRARYNLLLLSEMLRLQELCRARGLEVIFTKGLLLSQLICGDFTSRAVSDLDIMVRKEDFKNVRALLIGEGYEELYPFPQQELSYFLQYQREAAFVKHTESGQRVHVELQWSVLPSYYRMPYGTDYFFRNTMNARIGQATVTTLDHTAHLLLLLAHHGAGDLWRNLRHLADIALFVQVLGHDINWDEVDDLIKRWGISNATACGLAMTENLVLQGSIKNISLPVSPSLLRHCTHYIFSVPMLPKHRTHRATFVQQMRLSDSGRDRYALFAGFVKRYCSPGMEELALVRLPKLLFPAYLLIRQFRFLYKGRAAAPGKLPVSG